MRTKLALRNSLWSVLTQIAAILISFIARTIFLRYLSIELLGLGSVITNIISLFSLAEAGVSIAITQSLFKPITQKDNKKITEIYFYYKKFYKNISLIVVFVGFTTIPFLHFIIDYNLIPLYFTFGVYFLVSLLQYSYATEKALLNANHYVYLNSITRYTMLIILNIAQIIVLVITKNYYIYIAAMLLTSFIELVLIKWIFSKKISKDLVADYYISEEVKIDAKKNYSSLIIHKLGSVFVNSTDNVIISIFLGLSIAGIYNNYFLIVNSVSVMINLVFSSIIAEVGNFNVLETKENKLKLFEKILFLNVMFYLAASIMIFFSINTFINIWLGEYLLEKTSIILIVILFFLNGIRRTTLLFRDSMGLYRKDVLKPIFESIINLVISIIFVQIWGLQGIFLGTLVSLVFTCMWIEPYVVYKFGFHIKILLYFKKLFIYILVSFFAFIVNFYVLDFFPIFFASNNFFSFLMILLVTGFISITMFVGLTYRSHENQFYRKLFFNLVTKKIMRRG